MSQQPKTRKKQLSPKPVEAEAELVIETPSASRYGHYSVDRLEDIVNGPNRWCVAAVKGVLIEEFASQYDDELHYATFAIHKDLSTVGDLLRAGAPALSARFREVDPLAWTTLIEHLAEANAAAS